MKLKTKKIQQFLLGLDIAFCVLMIFLSVYFLIQQNWIHASVYLFFFALNLWLVLTQASKKLFNRLVIKNHQRSI